MTAIKQRQKPVWHETGAAESGRPICVAETPAGLLLRLKGCRESGALLLPWTMAYLRAAMLEAMTERMKKINRRRSVRRGALALA